MIFEVKNRSVESWGPLADCDEATFVKLISYFDAKTNIKNHIKYKKKLKSYRVQFNKKITSDFFVVYALNDMDIGTKAKIYFNENKKDIEFKLKSDSMIGYDSISYVRIKK